MATTLKLKKKPATGTTTAAPRGRPPVRGAGSAPRKRPTLAEAKAERAQHAARRAEDSAQRAARRTEDSVQRRPVDDQAAPRRPTKPAPKDTVQARSRKRPEPARQRGTERTASGAPVSRPAPRRELAPPPIQAARSDHAKEGAGSDGSLRLSKRMSELGLASRREADEWIEAGWVRVDGAVVNQLGARVRPQQQISIDPRAETQQAQRVTILLHKPVGYVSGQAEDGYEPAVTLVTAANRWQGDRAPLKFAPAQLRHLAPAGRLDIDSTGLLVLTQDGRIAKQLIGEDSGIEKEYLVRVSWPEHPELKDIAPTFPAEKLELLRHGLSLDGVQLRPAKVSWQNEQQLRFVLREGRKRQIRRMCELVGLKVLGLKRVRMGRIVLGELPPGQWRYLRWDERF